MKIRVQGMRSKIALVLFGVHRHFPVCIAFLFKMNFRVHMENWQISSLYANISIPLIRKGQDTLTVGFYIF